MTDANQEGIACSIPLQWGQSFDFWGEEAGCFRYTVCKQEKWVPSILPQMNEKHENEKLPL